MAKSYLVHVDVTFSGNIQITANTKKEAKEKAKALAIATQDIENFYHVKTAVVDVL